MTSEVHTPGPGDERPGAAGALAGPLLNEGTAGPGGRPTRPLDLEAARERCRQASEGPWKPSPNAGDAVIAPKAKRLDGIDTEYYGGPVVGESMHPADRDFVIHARTDLPAALEQLAEVRRLLETSPFGPTLKELRRLAFEIRRVVFPEQWKQEEKTDG